MQTVYCVRREITSSRHGRFAFNQRFFASLALAREYVERAEAHFLQPEKKAALVHIAGANTTEEWITTTIRVITTAEEIAEEFSS